jgi:hypothetical protein
MRAARICLLATVALVAPSAFAQEVPIAPAPPPIGGTAEQSVGNPAVASLMQSDKLSKADAEERIALQADILAFLQKSDILSNAGFVDLAVQHEPVYQIWLNFVDNSDKASVLKEIPPKMRRYVKIRKAKRNRDGRGAGFTALAKAVAGTGKAYPIGYDSIAELYFVEVPDQATKMAVESAIPPGLTTETEVQIREIPQVEQSQSTTTTPTGVVAGDWAAAGYRSTSTASSTNPGAPCTLAFPVAFVTNLRGILTAGHCTEPKYVRYSDHDVTFTAAYIERTTGNYDFSIYRTDGLSTDYQLYYRNTFGIPEFPASGWLNTKNFIRGANQWQGMSVCISGSVTGLACGKIMSAAYDWRGTGTSSFVLLSSTAQGDLSQGGDSGAPTFAYVDPRTTTDISATGIHVAGSGTGSTARSVYMPIDRIFEVGVTNLKLVTTP